jgi:transaldolase
LLADDIEGSTKSAVQLHARAQCPNLFIKIPGTRKGIPAIEETIFAGVPVNVTLLFSREQYTAAAEAYLRGIERRIAAGLDPKVDSVASIFVSRWDVAVKDKVSDRLRNRLGIAIAKRTYRAYRDLLASPRWRKLVDSGAGRTLALGQHRHERPGSLRDLVHRSARSSGYHQHDARKDIARLRRARSDKRCVADRRR